VRQNAPFFAWITTQRPFVIVKAAVSSDGFVGRLDRRVKLTGHEADRWFQRQRAEVDAIAVGSTTVIVDDPLLTARRVYRERSLTRVIFDRRGRVAPTARVFSTLAAGPVIMIVSERVVHDRPEWAEALGARGVTIVQAEAALPATLQQLGRREMVSLLIEGGPTLQQAFFEADLVDRVQVVTTPHRLLAGVAAPEALRALGQRGSAFDPRAAFQLGADAVKEVDVHRFD
jgi:diaminohydroxyphosphoribosylaminopyrimidine deaminase / 5-amino-6-(5-phosphoribosylamino)uracil reductase